MAGSSKDKEYREGKDISQKEVGMCKGNISFQSEAYFKPINLPNH